ncbi:hypothetical protein B0T18DRAFT_221492 [Schizothecium vesticola]|uniref:Secreted protein n=1 Tax=Schizothecium vesticola TaxID=314040 RepID=A0AA40EKE6_9PEZI|nr:hypothetical protein B0T18DRAFT_221492 [Schizothecium vesticola]
MGCIALRYISFWLVWNAGTRYLGTTCKYSVRLSSPPGRPANQHLHATPLQNQPTEGEVEKQLSGHQDGDETLEHVHILSRCPSITPNPTAWEQTEKNTGR